MEIDKSIYNANFNRKRDRYLSMISYNKVNKYVRDLNHVFDQSLVIYEYFKCFDIENNEIIEDIEDEKDKEDTVELLRNVDFYTIINTLHYAVFLYTKERDKFIKDVGITVDSEMFYEEFLYPLSDRFLLFNGLDIAEEKNDIINLSKRTELIVFVTKLSYYANIVLTGANIISFLPYQSSFCYDETDIIEFDNIALALQNVYYDVYDERLTQCDIRTSFGDAIYGHEMETICGAYNEMNEQRIFETLLQERINNIDGKGIAAQVAEEMMDKFKINNIPEIEEQPNNEKLALTRDQICLLFKSLKDANCVLSKDYKAMAKSIADLTGFTEEKIRQNLGKDKKVHDSRVPLKVAEVFRQIANKLDPQ